MNKKFNKFSIVLLIILMITTISIGCQPEDEPDQGNDGDIDDNEDIDDNDNDIIDDAEEDVDDDMNGNDDDNDDMNGNDDDMNGNGEGEDISNDIVGMDGVNDATVVIRDQTAIIGVDAVDATDGEVSEELRQEIESRVRETNENINEVYISSEPDLFDRIDVVAQDIRAGDPIDEFTDELDDLVDALTPDLD